MVLLVASTASGREPRARKGLREFISRLWEPHVSSSRRRGQVLEKPPLRGSTKLYRTQAELVV